MEFKGTKGEWVLSNEINDEERVCVVSESNDNFIDVWSLTFSTEGEMRANAKLIAAAPDLLEELVTLLSNIDEMGNTGEDMMELRNYLSDARKAINKALK